MCRFPEKYRVPLLPKGVYVQMILRMLAKQVDIIHSLRCLEISVLGITSRRKQLNGLGSFQPWSMYELFSLHAMLVNCASFFLIEA